MNTGSRRLAGMLVLLPGLTLAEFALAQQPQSSQASQPPGTSGALPLNAEQLALLDVRASELIGKDVTNPQGEDLGKIEDLILDVENSKVRYAVVAYGGFLGLGNRLAAFPPTLFRPGKEEGEIALNVTREQLEQAPGFAPRSWPDLADESYSGDVDRFFLKGDELVHADSGGRLVRASDIIGKEVSDGGNRKAGHMEDLVVNLGNGQIRYTVLNYGSRLGFNQRLVPLPMTAFRVPTRPDLPIFLLLDRDRVAKAQAFDEDNWPDLQSARERREVDDWLSQFPQGGQPQQPASGGGAGERGGQDGQGKSASGTR
jgi:sporulation protein YlmC with PRC-barrel domain